MAVRELSVEHLVNRRVYALNGRNIGRIEEIRAEARDGEWRVTEYLVGVYAVLERLAAWSLGRAILKLLRMRRKGGYRIPWDRLDLSDPERPRLKCAVGELPLLEDEE